MLSSPRGLHAASRAGDVARIRELLRSGADPDQEQRLLFDKTSLKYTPLVWAVRGGSDAAVEALVAGGADVNKPVGHRSPLAWAIGEGSDGVVAALIQHPAIDIHVVNFAGQNALYSAISHCRDAAARELVRRNVDFRRVDNFGVTCIELACGAVGTRGSDVALDAMLDCGLSGDELVGARFKDGTTVLMFACRYCGLDIVQKALQSSRNVDAVDASGRSAADYSRERSDGQTAKILSMLRK
ncbi:MAG: ankyrin repeat domain-containing protein [Phycisphaerales bacterium]|nr:ankyrin repeat domain-containing protein [Phycisphaerales bacterium]